MASSTANIMGLVLIALLPGFAALTWFFGAGITINVVVAMATAMATEWLILKVRGYPLARMKDNSALVTGALLGLCLPPFVSIWIVVGGVAFAILIGKHLYGGLGHNLFNPAMTGYAMMIISFPLAMSLWPEPGSSQPLALLVEYKLGVLLPDAVAMATPLDAFKFRGGVTIEEFQDQAQGASAAAWGWINGGFLAGGLLLLARKLCDWVLPLSMLATLAILSMLFYDGGSSSSAGSPWLHLMCGATMMAAFFIITDPVTAPGYRNGRIIFGVGVGAITFLIRTIGAYPEGIAFAVLLMNATTPLIDQARFKWTG